MRWAIALLLLITACGKTTTVDAGTTTTAAPEPAHVERTIAKVRLPKDIVVDHGTIYAIDADPDDPNETANVLRIGGGRIDRLATNQPNGQSLAIVGSDLLWIASGDVDKKIPDGVFRMPTNGGTPVRIATTFVFADAALAVRDVEVFFHGPLGDTGNADITKLSLPSATRTKVSTSDRNAERQAIAVDAVNVYWLELGNIMKASASGGSPTKLADAEQVRGMASDGLHLYWTDMRDGRPFNGLVKRVPIGGGAVEILDQRVTRPWGIAVDDKAIYWACNGDHDGTIIRWRKNGPALVIIASNQNAPVHVALDNANVYWTNAGDGTVKVTTK